MQECSFFCRLLAVEANKENVKYLPPDVPCDLSHFELFMDGRKKLMSEALKTLLF